MPFAWPKRDRLSHFCALNAASEAVAEQASLCSAHASSSNTAQTPGGLAARLTAGKNRKRPSGALFASIVFLCSFAERLRSHRRSGHRQLLPEAPGPGHDPHPLRRLLHRQGLRTIAAQPVMLHVPRTLSHLVGIARCHIENENLSLSQIMQGLRAPGICAMTHHNPSPLCACPFQANFPVSLPCTRSCALPLKGLSAGSALGVSRAATDTRFLAIGCGKSGVLFSAAVSPEITIVADGADIDG